MPQTSQIDDFEIEVDDVTADQSLHVNISGFKVCVVDRRQDPDFVFDFCRPVKRSELDALLAALAAFRDAPTVPASPAASEPKPPARSRRGPGRR